MDKLLDALARTVPASNARFLPPAREANQAVRKLTRVALDRELRVATAKNDSAATTRCRAIFTEPASTKFAAHQCATPPTYHLVTVFTLVHLVALPAIKSVAAIAYADRVISEISVAPVVVGES